MNIKYDLTKKVSDFLENSELEEIGIGCSNSQVIKITKEDGLYFLKVAGKGILTSEYNKLSWLNGKLSVPSIVLYDSSLDNEYLITEAMPGKMVFLEDPELGLKIIKEAFKSIEKVDIKDCPFNMDIDYKLSLINNNLSKGLIKEKNIKEEFLKKYKSLDNIINYLKENKFKSDPCFSFGDISLPNIFSNNGKFSGFVDVGECGIADKWFDLAICEKSIRRNYGEEYVEKFYEELGVVPDRKKIDYYILMMEVL